MRSENSIQIKIEKSIKKIKTQTYPKTENKKTTNNIRKTINPKYKVESKNNQQSRFEKR